MLPGPVKSGIAPWVRPKDLNIKEILNMRCDSADVKQLLARWDYDPDAVDTYGRAMEAAMGNPEARAVL